MVTSLKNPRRQPRSLPYLQLSRCPGCPVCGALPFELCMNIPQDPDTRTRWVHSARLRRLEKRVGFYGRLTLRARRRLTRGKMLRKAA